MTRMLESHQIVGIPRVTTSGQILAMVNIGGYRMAVRVLALAERMLEQELTPRVLPSARAVDLLASTIHRPFLAARVLRTVAAPCRRTSTTRRQANHVRHQTDQP